LRMAFDEAILEQGNTRLLPSKKKKQSTSTY
jgi:hypothetical protein